MNEINSNSIGEIIEPAPIGFEFGAPGWYLLLILLALIGITVAIRALVKYRKNKYRRVAVQELKKLIAFQTEDKPVIYDFILMLKKVAIITYSKPLAGNLFGIAFCEFLKTKTTQENLFHGKEEIFSKSLYQQNNLSLDSATINAFYEDSIHWIKKHHV